MDHIAQSTSIPTCRLNVNQSKLKTRIGLAFVLVLLALSACAPSPSPEELAVTYVAATDEFSAAVAEAVSTGIAATFAAIPTNTATSTSTSTPRPTATLTSTVIPSSTPTASATPTTTATALPTETGTPDAATAKLNQLYARLADLKYYAEQLYSGVGGTGTGYVSCSRELRDSIVVNLENVRALPTFDDSLLSRRAIGVRINYDSARSVILESADLEKWAAECVAWIDAGKPEDFEWGDRGNTNLAAQEMQRAITLAEAGLNN